VNILNVGPSQVNGFRKSGGTEVTSPEPTLETPGSKDGFDSSGSADSAPSDLRKILGSFLRNLPGVQPSDIHFDAPDQLSVPHTFEEAFDDSVVDCGAPTSDCRVDLHIPGCANATADIHINSDAPDSSALSVPGTYSY
jgi:hypothetical protein